ncbi:MAG: hypothetical protein R3C10_16820 [Pirellulales bacterium]
MDKAVTPVEVDDPDIRDRLGIDRYYQLELFTADSQHNPIVCCLLELPSGMPTGGGIQEDVALTGFLMKKWAYRGERSSAQTDVGDQGVIRLAPLVISRTVDWHRATVKRNSLAGVVAAAIFAVVFAAIVGAVWRSNRRDGAARRDLRR